MNPLEEKIIRVIAREGPVTFEKFMEMSLYDSEYGYYSSPEARIGREGDFYTSSHLHPVFGMLLGRQIEEMWEFMERPDDFTVIEMGPGAGFLCRDMLDSLTGKEFFRAVRYRIVERNPTMVQTQKDLLDRFADKVQWVSSLGELGEVRGCLLSNELLDAFPVHVVLMDDELKEIYVTYDKDGLTEVTGPLSTQALREYFGNAVPDFERGYRTEVNLRIRDWLRDAGDVLKEGFVFTIDYGYTSRDYYSEDRNRGTLMCYSRHQLKEDPLRNAGEQDITAHVNFSSVKKWGEEVGLCTAGFCSQGAFLVSLGIDEEIRRLSETSQDYLFELGRMKKLFLPQGMGESHMVMIQYKGIGKFTPLRGFAIRNQIRFL